MNKSGMTPSGDRVVVLPDVIEQVSPGGIIIPESEMVKYQVAQHTGILVAVGEDAWSHTVGVTERLIDGEWKAVERTTTGFSKPFAEVGDRVCFAKYNGLLFDGDDGKKYRLLNDVDITGVVSETIEFVDFKARVPLSHEQGA